MGNSERIRQPAPKELILIEHLAKKTCMDTGA